MESLQTKHQRVLSSLREFERAIVAFSGGVDSTLLAKLARDVLGRERALAVTADSPSLAREDLDAAVRTARQLDLQHLVVRTAEVNNPAYQANPRDRCYFCKQELFDVLGALARERGVAVVLYGAIGDDRHDDRPGEQAARERGIRGPLQEAGLEKWEVRELSRALGLPNWDLPQNACLSSRVPHGQEVTVEKLRQVEAAEGFLRAQGFRQVRVRHDGHHARIEVGSEEVGRFSDAQLCVAVAQQFEQLGFVTVGVDRRGYRAGGADIAADEVPLDAICKC